jgi:hypothetical protein
MDIKEFAYEGLDWIHFVNMAVNLVGSKTALVRGMLVFCHSVKWVIVEGLPFQSLGAIETASL